MTGTVPRVTVVMPVFNCGAFLEPALRSVVSQTYSDWELLAVDDGSTDGSGEVLDRWASREPRIRVVHQPNSGLPAAVRNRAIREARGDVIAFLDGDDLYHPEKLSRAMEILDALSDVGAVFHDFRWFTTASNPEEGLRYLQRERYFERAAAFFRAQQINGRPVYLGTTDLIKFMSSEILGIHTSAIAIRKSVLERLAQPPFRPELPHGEDIDLWLRVARATALAAFPDCLSYYRHHAGSWMSVKALRTLALGAYRVKGDMLRQLERDLAPDELPGYREKISAYWAGLAYRCLVAGLTAEARTAYRESLRVSKSGNALRRAAKGLAVSALPRWIVQRYWRATGGGEFAARQPPAPGAG